MTPSSTQGGSAEAKLEPTSAPPAASAASAAAIEPAVGATLAGAATNPWPGLNLGFERVDGSVPAGWESRTRYSWSAVSEARHGGERSLRLQSPDARGAGSLQAEHGAVLMRLPVDAVRGRMVRLHGWIKTEEVAGLAGLFLQARGRAVASDNMPWTRQNGTTDWTEASVEIDVPAGADTIELGGFLTGEGTAWFDDLQLEAFDGPGQGSTPPISLAGIVVDTAGQPVADAEVALQSGGGVYRHLRSGADGRFRFEVTAGRWGFSVSHAGDPRHVGSFVDTRLFAQDAKDVTLTLEGSGGVEVRGQIGPGQVPPESYVQLGITSNHDADAFPVLVAPDGSFTVQLPRGEHYFASLLGPVAGRGEGARHGDQVAIDIALPVRPMTPPLPAEVAPWIAAHAIPLATTEPGHGTRDLAPLARLVGKARVVALGEATHGTREFFQLKHRVLEYLVATQGFTVFAIEADQAECRLINDYVLHGIGDPRVALDGLYKWPWDTEEVLAMIEWMRAWNAAPAHRRKVEFHGFDMLTSRLAYAGVFDFLRKVDPEGAPGLLAPILVLARHTAGALIAKLSQAEVEALSAGLHALAGELDRHRADWTKRTSTAAFELARHDVTLLEQSTERYLAAREGLSDGVIRGRAMAANLMWILDHQPAGTRMVVWAHNSHVANRLDDSSDPAALHMGGYLDRQLGAGYLSIGFLFSEGAFQIWTTPRNGLHEVTIGAPAATDASVPFHRSGKPLFALDLRTVPAHGAVHDWFVAKHPVRQGGVTFSTEAEMERSMSLRESFDAVIFVDHTTRARPLAFP